MPSPDPPLDPLDALLAAKRGRALDERSVRTLFGEARSANGFLNRSVAPELLDRMVELAQFGPTSNNASPMRVTFVISAEAKERLVATLSPGNVAKTLQAPVTAIVAADTRFYEAFDVLAPGRGLAARFAEPERAPQTADVARTNATLQGAYLMLAARALGLDVGPMGGFDRAALDAAFFADGRCRSLWLVNLGYGDDTKLRARLPRLPLDAVRRFS